jgi:hypothetical protein
MVIALVGRRIDAEDAAEARFPLAMVPFVRERLRSLFLESGVTTMVSSAANGADLIALEEAGHLDIRRVVILAANRDRFREGSVSDRPGEWSVLYDRALDEIDAKGDLHVLGTSLDHSTLFDRDAFAKVNRRILDDAERISSDANEPLQAVVVWNGRSRGDGDLTEEFAVEARRRGIPLLEIDSLGENSPATE